ncbi:MAG: hypothetical protein GTN64_08135, partial [Candidatus Latescibacteria bacterium]|nr:hypothetical protein [Candidatus Latescibacterota bacterium]NIO78571.1 hypothetical protein [Candidatus Latescibacterota bacterium]
MLRIQAKGLNDTISKMEKAPEKMQVSLSKNIHWSTMRVHREAVFLASGPIIKVRSGKTRAGINWEVDERNLVGRVGSKQIHMRQIEYGGRISAKPPRRFLTIPLDAAKTAAGVA